MEDDSKPLSYYAVTDGGEVTMEEVDPTALARAAAEQERAQQGAGCGRPCSAGRACSSESGVELLRRRQPWLLRSLPHHHRTNQPGPLLSLCSQDGGAGCVRRLAAEGAGDVGRGGAAGSSSILWPISARMRGHRRTSVPGFENDRQLLLMPLGGSVAGAFKARVRHPRCVAGPAAVNPARARPRCRSRRRCQARRRAQHRECHHRSLPQPAPREGPPRRVT
jgi:hypothetical protein